MQIGEKYLITADNWFYAPDGDHYRAVFGTVHGVIDSHEALGVRTNARSTNWYVAIGDTILAGCQIHYAMRTDKFNPMPVDGDIDHDGKRIPVRNLNTRIYDADASGLKAFGSV